MLTSAASLIGDTQLRVIDESVTHGERRSPQKVRFVDETPCLPQSKVGLVNQRGRLQRVPRAKTCARATRNAPQLLIESRK